MAALNIEFTADELDLIRQAADKDEVSMKKLAHDAVVSELHRRRVAAAAVRTARISAELNRRLAQ